MIGRLSAGIVAVSALALAILPAQADEIVRLSGAVNYRNYPAVEKLFAQATEVPLVLDLTIPVDNDEALGHLTTFVLDGQLELAFHAKVGGSRLYVQSGFELVDDSYYALKGIYTARWEMDEGVRVYEFVDAAVPADAAFKDIKAESLEEKN